MSATPPNRSAQFPDRPNHLSSEYETRPDVEIRPATKAPEIIVMPPT